MKPVVRNHVQRMLLKTEADRRVRRALALIEEAQGNLTEATAVLSSLRYAAPQWRATSKLQERVRAHWYRVQDGLVYSKKAQRVALDPMAAEALLEKAATLRLGAP